ncbi:unnamed protein product [Brassica oleracea var. botrytis]|uniref:Uncharacterized protein n=1 Tax=Brassica napus TaxID=3708 RepID=A0ABQ7YCP7_BRANA|nr:hypothetical protein HID58_082212 [Brassica napus]
MEASILLKDINNISNSIGTRGGGNDNEDGLGEHYRDKVSPCADSVVHMSVSEAEKRLKKLERDYQHTYKSYLETRSNRYSSYIKRRHSNYNSGQAGNCIIYFKNLREKLQNDLEKLNKAEETQKRTDKPDYFSYTQSIVPKSSSSKGIHDLLRSLKDTKKLRNKGTASGELVDNQTSQDSLKTSIKILTIVIKKLGKETGRDKMIVNGYEEKIKHVEKKCEWICGQWDEQKKCIVELSKNT